jgi:mRNA interferase RelE/StbE
MPWKIKYLPEAVEDLDSLNKAAAQRVLTVIEERIINGDPENLGKPLRHELAGCRRIRTGDTRIVYKVHADQVMVLVVAVGPRRNQEVYKAARRRL